MCGFYCYAWWEVWDFSMAEKKKRPLKKRLKKFLNGILHLPPLQWLVAGVAALFTWALYFSCRVTVRNKEVFKKYRRSPAIFVFWHGRSLMLSPVVCMGGMRGYVVTSPHGDGRMMAKLQNLFGLRAVFGSSTNGGAGALLGGVRVLRQGKYAMCLSPDGPSGPAMQFHDGALYFAKMTGAPIIPVCFSASRAWIWDKWDKFLVPKFFSRVVVDIKNPVFVPRKCSDAEFEEIRAGLEKQMQQQLRDLDAEFGLPDMVEVGMTATIYKQRRREARAAAKAQKRKKGL